MTNPSAQVPPEVWNEYQARLNILMNAEEMVEVPCSDSTLELLTTAITQQMAMIYAGLTIEDEADPCGCGNGICGLDKARLLMIGALIPFAALAVFKLEEPGALTLSELYDVASATVSDMHTAARAALGKPL